MKDQNNNEVIRGISVCNPVDVEKEYLLYTVEYARENDFNHMQIIGPIHDTVKGNIDGMTMYRKYSQFNNEKNAAYVKQAMEAINEACEKNVAYGIKCYVWHHELELPSDFQKEYPEAVNDYGDVEVTHSRVKDFLEHKIADFFYYYPHIDGIILTLHETKVPLLKLKKQKLSKIERVKYVTKILYDECLKLGKELIVRPFASLEEDYVMMASAYEEISTDLVVMDKWTQFDWSLSLPNNQFYRKIKNNPIFVEADIFGEFFGKGRLPLMLKEHIAEKFMYCSEFRTCGYVARIDRGGEIPFGDVNEVNIHIMNAYLHGNEPDEAIDEFFLHKYGEAGNEVRKIMERTEDILRKTLYTKGYYFTELSFFPSLNHSKNHYYFEMMRKRGRIESDEWYIPSGFGCGDCDTIIREKEEAVREAEELFEKIQALKEAMEAEEYHKLWIKFCNLKYVTRIWRCLVDVYVTYAAYFEEPNPSNETRFYDSLTKLNEEKESANTTLGEKFYCNNVQQAIGPTIGMDDFLKDIRKSFEIEKEITADFNREEGLVDYVICGGAMEGHGLRKEVNYSDTLIVKDSLCRIPGNQRGAEWSSINAHGWFSYDVRIQPHAKNLIEISMGSTNDTLDVKIQVGTQEYTLQKKSPNCQIYHFVHVDIQRETSLTIRFDKISKNAPNVYWIKVKR